MLLWLDDVRPAPPGWTHARSVNAAITLTLTGPVRFMSLDHDLGDYAVDGGDASAFTDWLAEYDRWPTEGLRVHSANPVGVQAMLATVDRYAGFPPGYGNTRGRAPEGGWPSPGVCT